MRWRSELLAAPILVVLALWLYSPGMQGFFVSDDYLMLSAAQELLKMPLGDALREVFASDIYRTIDTKLYRPMWVVSFLLQLPVSGNNYASYVAVDILLHALNGLLLVSILAVVTRRRFASVFAGVLFVAGGIHADAVLWLVSRYALLTAMFVLVAIRLALAGRLLPAFVATLFGLLTGEQGVAAVPLVGLAAAWRCGEPGLRARGLAALRAVWPFLLLFVAYMLWRRHMLGVFFGGYSRSANASIFSSWWVTSRFTLLDALVAPAHPLYVSGAARIALRLLALLLLVGVLWTGRRRSGKARGDGDWLLWLWLLLVFGPIFKVGVQADTLRDSRLLYQPAMAWAALVALGVERAATLLRSPVRAHVARTALALGLVAVQAALLIANRTPWIEAPRISARFHAELEPLLREQTERPLAITDIAGIHDGAYLGLAGNTMMFMPFFVGFTATRPWRVYVDNELDLLERRDIRKLVEDIDSYRSAQPPLPPIQMISVAPDGGILEIPLRPPQPVALAADLELRAGHASPRRLPVGAPFQVGLRLCNRSGAAFECALEFRRGSKLYGMLPLTIPPGDPVTVNRVYASMPPLVPGPYEVVIGGAVIAEIELLPARR